MSPNQMKHTHLIFTTRHAKGAVLMSNIIYGREKCYERDVKEYEKECWLSGISQGRATYRGAPN